MLSIFSSWLSRGLPPALTLPINQRLLGSPKSTDLGAIVRQLSPEDCSRFDSGVYIEVPVCLVWKLVDVHVKITVKADRSTVRPDDTRVF